MAYLFRFIEIRKSKDSAWVPAIRTDSFKDTVLTLEDAGSINLDSVFQFQDSLFESSDALDVFTGFSAGDSELIKEQLDDKLSIFQERN